MTTPDLERAVGRLEGKLDQIISHQQDVAEHLRKTEEEFRTRVRGVERQHWMIMGGLAVVMFIIQVITHH